VSAVELFQAPTGGQVRAVLIDSEPWFVAADVTGSLGYGGGRRNAVGRLPERMRGVASVNTLGGSQAMTVINEAGVYRLAMRSNAPKAEAFQDWLAEEVVPAIRRTGRFEIEPQPIQPRELSKLEVLEMALESERRAIAAESKVMELEPSAQAWDVLASAHGDYSVREAAFILNRDPAIDTGQQRLFKLLRDWGLIDSKDRPYASHANHVTLRARSYEHPVTREERTTSQVRITAAGLRYIHRRLGGIELGGVA
jgi:anti-repressor protein